IARAHKDTVATVGFIKAEPGIINVIAGAASLTLDLRSADDAVRAAAYTAFLAEANGIAAVRGVGFAVDVLLDAKSCPCSPSLVAQIEGAVARTGIGILKLPSGAGHDGMAMSGLTDIGMIFVRCKDGVSHSPAESVSAPDVAAGAAVLLSFIENFSKA
ncbi:MAG: M20/M25/M40 family metallo-hydrolase, partial [Parvibaculaceae bacterium]